MLMQRTMEIQKKVEEGGVMYRRAPTGSVKRYAGDDLKRAVDEMELEGVDPDQTELSLFEFNISDETEDRHGDIIRASGWDLRVFQKSQAVLWAHQADMPPVLQAVKTWQDGGVLKSVAQALEPGIYPFADMVAKMLEKRYLNMASVGFIPLEYQQRKNGSFEFVRQELTEYSIVPSGSNRNAFLGAQDDPTPKQASTFDPVAFAAQVAAGLK